MESHPRKFQKQSENKSQNGRSYKREYVDRQNRMVTDKEKKENDDVKPPAEEHQEFESILDIHGEDRETIDDWGEWDEEKLKAEGWIIKTDKYALGMSLAQQEQLEFEKKNKSFQKKGHFYIKD